MRFVLMLSILLTSAPALAMRCGNRLISVGDSALELRARCGTPSHIDRRTEVITRGAPIVGQQGLNRPQTSDQRRPAVAPIGVQRGVGVTESVRETVETWLYAGKKGSLGRLVTVRRGKVTNIATVSSTATKKGDRCKRDLHRLGTKASVIAVACGAPDHKASWEESRAVTTPDGLAVETRVIKYERWTYRAGPGRLLRTLTFANGALEKSETGGRLD